MNINMASIARPAIGQTDFAKMVSDVSSAQQAVAANQQAQAGAAASGMINAFNSQVAAAQAAQEEQNRTYLILGGIAVVGVVAGILLLKKK